MKKMKIAHIADVHVRPNQYLDEMQFTFDRLFESLKEEKVDLVVICGDFFHSKLTVSSEYFSIAFKFFENLAKNYKTIVIPGNHDSALSNQGRLDAITPIVESVNSLLRPEDHEIIYIKENDSYSLHFVDFHHFSIYSDKDSWPKKENLDTSKINIALYHGAINNCIVDNGWTSRGNRDDISIFDGFDFAFLGDIHKFQFLNEEKTIAYPGSLRQNNFGEDIDKGYLLWEISDDGKFTVERRILDQKRYFFTLHIDSAKELDKIGELPEDSRFRIRTSKQLDINEEIELKTEIIKRYKPTTGEIQITPPDESYESNQSIKVGNLDIIHENIRDIEIQKSLIEEFLKKKDCSKEEIEAVLTLDKKYHSSVDTDVLRNIVFEPLKLKWDNFFSYGKSNQVNFNSLGNGLIGIFGNTGSGKSSIFDILFFSLFNSIFKEGANKNGDYVNRKCKRADSSLEIGLNGGKFVIERGIKKVYTEGKEEPKVENNVDFYKLPKTNENSLNGETGPDTNKFIRDTFGTKEDAEMLSHCSQFGLMNFIDAKGTKRKEILSKFFDLNVFDFKFDLASKDHKEIKIKLKDCDKVELLRKKAELEKILQDENLSLSDADDLLKEKIEENSKTIEQKIILKSKLENLPEKLDLTVNQFQYQNFCMVFKNIENQINDSKFDSIRSLTKEENQIYENKKNEHKQLSIKLPIFEKQALLVEKIPGVEECKKCVLVSDSYRAAEQKNEILQKLKTLEEATVFAKLIEEFSNLIQNREIYKTKIEKIETEIAKNEKYKSIIENNSILTKEIDNCDDYLESLSKDIEKRQKTIRQLIESIADKKAKIEIINEKLKIESDLIEKDKIFNLYLEAMGKNGISYWIISKKLNLVSKLVNQILAHATSSKFSIEENEEEKSLKCFVIDEKGKRPIELASGGEKTLVAIAIRSALWKICLLPKMPILILDESLVFLDSEKYDSAIKLIKYLLQEYFDKIFIISHNEELKRVVDNTLYIQTNKGVSHLELK